MDFKKRIKIRYLTAVVYIVLGLTLAALSVILESENEFVSPFSLALIVMGFARIRKLAVITKNEASLKQREIAENDERNVYIMLKAKNAAFSAYMLLAGIAVIALMFLEYTLIAQCIGYSVCALALIYWVCYWVYYKKS
jgi:hypothetical protein